MGRAAGRGTEVRGYFATGTEGAEYQAHYCLRCVNWQDDRVCWIWWQHFELNYAACNDKDHWLHKLIPRTDDGLDNGECVMFVDSSENTAPGDNNNCLPKKGSR